MVLVMIPIAASADIIYVNPGGSIQTGINQASPGDTVIVADGVYNEAGIQMKPGVKLRGASDDTAGVIINAGNPPIMDGIMYMNGCGDTTEVRGMTLASGTSITVSPYSGGGIQMVNSSPVLINVKIINCQAVHIGGGISCDNSSPTLTDVTLQGNWCANGGGGMACINGSNPSLETCNFIMNSSQAGGNVYCNDSSPTLSYCQFNGGATQNDGDGMYLTHSSSPILQNVSFGMMQSNLPNSHGQCVFIEVDSSPIFNNVCFMNSGLGYGELVYVLDASCSPTFSCCNAWGVNVDEYGGVMTDPTGSDGNISYDPLYCNPTNWDLTVDAASPNLPASGDNPCGVLIGALGQGCDSPVDRTSWGGIKAIYK
jgi:hypothetical protein